MNWKYSLTEFNDFDGEEPMELLKKPTYVLNILYINNGRLNRGIYLSKRLQKNKEMYDLWQSPGGKVEKGETSAQAAIRETLEETGLQIKEEEMGYLLNDPNFMCQQVTIY